MVDNGLRRHPGCIAAEKSEGREAVSCCRNGHRPAAIRIGVFPYVFPDRCSHRCRCGQRVIRCVELWSIQLQQRRQPVVSAFRTTKAHGECVVRSRREVFVPRPDSTEVLFPSQLITTCSCLQQCHFSPDRIPLLRTPKAAVKRNSSPGSFAVDN